MHLRNPAALASAVLVLSLGACKSESTGSGPWASVAAGMFHTVALRSDGTLWAFGSNAEGQLGTGGARVQPAPVQVGTFASWQAVSAGDGHTVALTQEGAVYAWGRGMSGQLGDGSGSAHLEPTALPTTARFKAVSAGAEHTAAIRTDGTLWAWGANWAGQVGDPASTAAHVEPSQIGTSTSWSAVSARNDRTLALREDGTLWTWGANETGYDLEPVQIGTATTWSAVSPGADHAVALRADGTLWVWGSNQMGQLGLGDDVLDEPDPVPLPTTARWTAAVAGAFHTVAVRSDGTVWTWGNGSEGELGAGQDVRHATVPTPVACAPASAVAGGYAHSAAVGTDGSLWAWGSAFFGQVGGGGSGYAEQRLAPEPVGAFSAIAARGAGASAIKADGTLWSWGCDVGGALGNGPASDDVPAPSRIGTASDWTAVVAGGYHMIATRAGGALWGFGADWSGQLGPGPAIWEEPALVATTATFVQASAGWMHTVALRDDGTLWSFGSDVSGQHGRGSDWTGAASSDPVLLATTAVWTAVSAGGDHTLAIRSDGTLWGWGDGGEGQVGDGASGFIQPSPVQVGTESDWTSVSTGLWHSLGIKADGSLWGWGFNGYGQVGVGSGWPSLSEPVRVGTETGWTEVSAGGRHSLGRRGGALYAWGDNSNGQLGDGTLEIQWAPVRIGTETTWTRVVASGSSSYALRGGTLHAWGNNACGQLGIGTTGRSHDRWVPAQVR